MPIINTNHNSSVAHNRAMWHSLKIAIAKSSGFQSWQKENNCKGSIDEQIRQYLRSTLETLAY